MSLIGSINNLSYCAVFLLLLLLLSNQLECKRTSSGGRRTGGGNKWHSSTNHHYPTHNSGNTNIGFEHFNQPPNTQSNKRPDIGFENVQGRLPPQNNQPNIGFNVPQQNHHSNNYNSHNQQNYQPGYNNQQSHSYGNHHHVNAGHYRPNQAYNNTYLSQPGSYFNPHYGNPGAVPPPIYQPVQQSSGSSFLGYAGSFAGGYLIGKLTSGGHDSNSNQYTVHHYYHNKDSIPKKSSISNNTLVTCSQNETQGLCVPNSFPVCLVNGTIMCVTHSQYTVPCGQNKSMSCVITVLPCLNGTNCTNIGDNSTNAAVYIPCISNATLDKSTLFQNGSTINGTESSNKVELCITAIAEPKKLYSPVLSYLNLIVKLLELPLYINNMLKEYEVNRTVTNSSVISVGS